MFDSLLAFITLPNVIAIGYLAILEGILSVDNALALAALVHGRLKDPEDQKRALRWGIVGAYVFRTAVIFCGVWLMAHWWIRGIAGLYLVWLSVNELFLKKGLEEGESEIGGFKVRWLSPLWSTIVAVECMDIMFSIDSVAVTLSISNHVGVLIAGAVMGILAMRFAAGLFIGLIKKYPILEKTAFILVLAAGLKIVAELAGIHVEEALFMGAMFAIIGLSIVFNDKLVKKVPHGA